MHVVFLVLLASVNGLLAIWDRSTVFGLGVLSFFAGTAAGALGIAAALIVGPSLLSVRNPLEKVVRSVCIYDEGEKLKHDLYHRKRPK